MWILRRGTGVVDDPDLEALRCAGARLYVELPKKGLVLHKTGSWEEATWDVLAAKFTTQLWQLPVPLSQQFPSGTPPPVAVQQQLAGHGHYRYAFHWREDPVPPPLQYYRQQLAPARLPPISLGWNNCWN